MTGRASARRIVVVGCDGDAAAVAGNLDFESPSLKIVQALDVPVWALGRLDRQERVRLDRLAERWIASLRGEAIDDVLLQLPWGAAAAADALTRRFAALPNVSVHLAPDRDLTWFRRPGIGSLGGRMTLRLARRPLSYAECRMKRAVDIVGAATLLLLLSPMMLVTAALVTLDSRGPIFFRQMRFGFNQTPFFIVKFRTMMCLEDGHHVRQASRGDSRVTRVGRILRSSSLDELPQLINVLRGEMSLIGPRPHAIAHDEDFSRKVALYAHRHNVKPGLTGWAQVNGFRGATDTDLKLQKRIEHDLFYIDNWSIAFDFKILLMTVGALIAPKNAF